MTAETWAPVRFRVKQRYVIASITIVFLIPAIYLLLEIDLAFGIALLASNAILGLFLIARPFSPVKGYRSGEFSVARGYLFVRIPSKDIVPFNLKHFRGYRSSATKFWLAGTGLRRGYGIELDFASAGTVEGFIRNIRDSGFKIESDRNPAQG